MVRENIKEFTVTEISASIKETLEDNFGYVKVRGEVSGLSKPASGHVYLNLKDENAIIKAIAWRSTVAKLSFMPDEGLEVICSRANYFKTFIWHKACLLYTSPSPRDQRGSRMPSSA